MNKLVEAPEILDVPDVAIGKAESVASVNLPPAIREPRIRFFAPSELRDINRTRTFFSLAIATSHGAKRSYWPANQALEKVSLQLNSPSLGRRNAIGSDSRCIGSFGR
jgi:hypothetical protein